MLLATLFVADVKRRGAVAAESFASRTLVYDVHGLTCGGSKVVEEFTHFDTYVAPLQRALVAALPPLPQLPPASNGFWVKEGGGGTVFMVTPRWNSIDALKGAIFAELKSSGRKLTVDQRNMKVVKHDGTPCNDMGGVLEATTSKTPYVITL
jgi:hypothetical protein